MRSVVVTGASRGIGLAIARKLVSAGYSVIGVARKQSPEFAAAMEGADGGASGALHFVPADLGQTDAIAALVRSIRGEFGAVYGLVNNAGIGTEGTLPLMKDSDIEQLIRVNMLAPILLTKYLVRHMMAEGGGRVVNLSSIVASTGANGLSVYAATKASLVGFTKSLAREVGRAGVNVNAVAPGYVATDMTRGMAEEQLARIVRRSALRRLAEADDVADAVEFLLSDRSKNITGTVLTVDAGNTA